MAAHAHLLKRRLLPLLVGALAASLSLAAAPAGALAASPRHHRVHRRHARRHAGGAHRRRRAAGAHARRHRAARRARRPRAHAARDPQANRTLSQATLWACETEPSAPACVDSVLAAINAAHAAEGVRPMRLPAGFTGLTLPQQLLMVTNLERTDRGLIPAIGLSRGLNRSALAGARTQQDPVPSAFYGDSYGSNWAGGIASALADDFLWMYDDGPGSFNVDCRAPAAAGCWGHRHNIVYAYHAPLVMGAAVAGASVTELLVGGDARTGPGQPDAPLPRRALR